MIPTGSTKRERRTLRGAIRKGIEMEALIRQATEVASDSLACEAHVRQLCGIAFQSRSTLPLVIGRQ